jgi:predicted N-acetyltransferase YhbS
MQPADFHIRLEAESDPAALSLLSAQAFGPGRFARTAYRIREGVAPVASLALAAWLDERIIGGIRFTEVAIGEAGNALLLGPLVVDPAHAGKGYGRALVQEGLTRARAEGFAHVLLVGDMPYYGRFGFVPVPPGQITLPGPVDPARLLVLELAPGAQASAVGQVKALASAPRGTR